LYQSATKNTYRSRNMQGEEAMSNSLFFKAALFIMAASFVFSEEPSPQQAGKGRLPISVSAGLEANNNHRSGVALGFEAQADYRILPFLAAGARGAFSTNFFFSNTVEAEGFVRFVVPLRGLEFFAQGGAGVSWIFIYEGNTAVPLFGGALGVRIPLGAFYVEPAARFGSPFLWGLGVRFGKDFGR
jgi:hypothetical protein